MSQQNYDFKNLYLSFHQYFVFYIIAYRIKLLLFATKSSKMKMKWPLKIWDVNRGERGNALPLMKARRGVGERGGEKVCFTFFSLFEVLTQVLWWRCHCCFLSHSATGEIDDEIGNGNERENPAVKSKSSKANFRMHNQPRQKYRN